ncbi:MAG: PSD1 domain-containing protein [Acidobacteria bacterium]|nr:PSD1 domain-containing protein [Acidobacteriota bacterium]
MRALLLLCCALPLGAQQPVEFFESAIRPLLAKHCYSCHSAKGKMSFAGLRLDSAAGIRKGSDSGPVIVAGDAAQSKLMKAVRGELPQRMPPAGRLSDGELAALSRWIEIGAPLPKETSPVDASAFSVEKRREQHWAWQPVRKPTPPSIPDDSWTLGAVDRFLLAGMKAKGMTPASPASRLALLRRVTYDLTGLPPTEAEIASFLADTSPGAHERLVDRLLASPRFGERMARRFMDIIRFSESHGSEGDPDVPQAWRYRDYVIRAFNDDVPYDQLIREHLAGDLLPNPRLREGRNESLLATAHYRMVEHGFQPVDPWEDRVKWTDNQIDVIAKAFQGLTITCARCHDHKFDAISQKDYYALFGIVAGPRPTQRAIDAPEVLARNREELRAAKPAIQRKLIEAWRRDVDMLAQKLAAMPAPKVSKESPLYPLSQKTFDTTVWSVELRKDLAERREFNAKNFRNAWDLRDDAAYGKWVRQGTGAPQHASAAGEFSILPEGKRAIGAIYPRGVYSHLLSNKHGAVISSPRFKVESDAISVRFLGGNFSFAQLIVENYAVPRGGIYHLRSSAKRDAMGWFHWDATFWKGFTAYIEFSTLDETTLFLHDDQDNKIKPKPQPVHNGRSWFGAQQVVFHNNQLTPKEEIVPGLLLLDTPAGETQQQYGQRLAAVVGKALDSWQAGTLSDEQAALLDHLLQQGLLSNDAAAIAEIAMYRRLENEIQVPTRAPGILEEAPGDHPLLIRGDHRKPGEAVPRRYLSALDSKPYPDARTMRLSLAEEIASPHNPLTARVIVNRLWQILFRRGIVRTVDNFGKLGEAPTHPELLDWLATRFVEDGWSVKRMLRLLATSQAYRMGDTVNPADPNNDTFHHIPLRRLEAEEIRDSILLAAGSLDEKMTGPSVPVFYAHDTGATKGDRPKGPLDGNGRRSVYLEIRRNATHPFLEVFDVYKPTSTRGQRDVTTVPAQSLALLNSPFVIEQAGKWAQKEPDVDSMFLRVFGRRPSGAERDSALTFQNAEGRANLIHALWNLKEFLYVR